jgi:hypothetical protein
MLFFGFVEVVAEEMVGFGHVVGGSDMEAAIPVFPPFQLDLRQVKLRCRLRWNHVVLLLSRSVNHFIVTLEVIFCLVILFLLDSVEVFFGLFFLLLIAHFKK